MGTPCPKPAKPHALVKRERAAALKAKDEAESRKVKARAQGRCECRQWYDDMHDWTRCRARACEVHHMKSGNGVRARGDSALARFKQHLCHDCHENIRLHVLVPLDPLADERQMFYRRVR
jgi:hypothetical protein